MKKAFIVFHVLVMQFIATVAYGQIRLYDMPPLAIDSLQKNKIRSFSPGMGGKNKVWDFTRNLGSKESYKIMFEKDSNNVFTFSGLGVSSYYRIISDTLIHFSCESPLKRKEYLITKLSNKFPLEYGDSVTKDFRCEGMYCGNHPFREIGTTTVHVDAIGAIILAEDDTIKNVRRVHTIDSYSICMDNNVASLDTARLTQVIDERYDWYVQGTQYPIIENVISTTYHNMDVIGTTRYAYCNLPEDKSALYISSDDNLLNDDSFDDLQSEPDIMHYNIETDGGNIKIRYDLDADATICAIVANHMGMTYSRKVWTQKAGHGYSSQIDCSGLRNGTYILYINVNGKIYSKKVIL